MNYKQNVNLDKNLSKKDVQNAKLNSLTSKETKEKTGTTKSSELMMNYDYLESLIDEKKNNEKENYDQFLDGGEYFKKESDKISNYITHCKFYIMFYNFYLNS